MTADRATEAEPYVVAGEVRRFSQHDTAFQRAKRDPTCAAFNKPHRPIEDAIASGRLHDAARLLIRARRRWVNRALVRLDDLFGYGA